MSDPLLDQELIAAIVDLRRRAIHRSPRSAGRADVDGSSDPAREKPRSTT